MLLRLLGGDAAPPAEAAPATEAAAEVGVEPNPPSWPDTVWVFSPKDSGAAISKAVQAAFFVNGGHDPPNKGQFSDKRFAFLFLPGHYDVDVPVGYYTTVHGLGTDPDDVVFTGERGVYCEEGDYDFKGGALTTFWRSAENFRTQANWSSSSGRGMLWAVSQAAPLRRVHVDNDLTVFEYQQPWRLAGYSSGGYMSNMVVGRRPGREPSRSTLRRGAAAAGRPRSTVRLGSQQQWFARNSLVEAWVGGVWNVVTVGVEGAPPSHCSNANGSVPISNVKTAPLVSEKPYLAAADAAGSKFNLIIPAVMKDSAGPEWAGPKPPEPTVVPFEKVYVAVPSDSAQHINAKLAAGLHVVLTPGIYKLDAALELTTEGQVLLGLGMATLIATGGTPLVTVGNVDGVRIAGVLVQAGPAHSDALIQWGTGGHAGSAAKPGFLHDVFARVGGPDGDEAHPVSAGSVLHIRSGHVIGDNMWLWRADHTVYGTPTLRSNAVDHGLVVEGDDVIMYGLAVEHTVKDLVQWAGERGRTYFFQSELPYHATQQGFGAPGYAGYRVNASVTAHDAWGVGVYSNFVDEKVTVRSAIVCPDSLVSHFTAPVTVHLSGNAGIQHVINQKGDAVGAKTQVSYVCS